MNRDNDPWRQFDEEHQDHSPGGYIVTGDKSEESDGIMDMVTQRSKSHRSLVLYQCGAWRENAWPGLGQSCEISPYLQGPLLLDALMEKATRIVTFWEIKLERAVAAFDDLKERLANVIPSHDDAEDAAVAHLRTLQAQVKQFKKELKKAEDARNKIDPTYVTPEQAEALARWEEEQATKMGRFQQKISKIRI